MNTFHHRIAIVTGASCSRGIGAAICRALATAGADVFFTHWSTYDAAMPWGAEADWPALLQRELQAMGVRCESMAVDLSATDTGWMPAELWQQLIEQHPQKRVGQPEDAARLVAFLASNAASWITGQIIHSREQSGFS